MIQCILSTVVYVHACPFLMCVFACVFQGAEWAVYVWYWVELRTAALGIQCYCCRSTLRQSSGKSRWAFHVEKIMTSLQSRPDISWTTLSVVSYFLCLYISLALLFDYCPRTVPLLTFLTSFFLLCISLIQQYAKQTNKMWWWCAASLMHQI